MNHRFIEVSFIVIAAVALMPTTAVAQSTELSRTAWGAPDLQGFVVGQILVA